MKTGADKQEKGAGVYLRPHRRRVKGAPLNSVQVPCGSARALKDSVRTPKDSAQALERGVQASCEDVLASYSSTPAMSSSASRKFVRTPAIAIVFALLLAFASVSSFVVIWHMQIRAQGADGVISRGEVSFVADSAACVQGTIADLMSGVSGDLCAEGSRCASGFSDSAFPVIDWDYWQIENPDVIGWISVPGTAIDYPIVQASASNTTYYLSHDAHGDYNIFGCPYLDADCSEKGLLSSENAVIFGHNMSSFDGSMFSDFARYTDETFARAHSIVLIQTPTEKRCLRIVGAAVSSGNSATKRTSFVDDEDFSRYCEERLAACTTHVFDYANVDYAQDYTDVDYAQDYTNVDYAQLFTFVTCSYTTYANERTLVYAVPDSLGSS